MCDSPAAMPGFLPIPFPVDLRSVAGFDKDEKIQWWLQNMRSMQEC